MISIPPCLAVICETFARSTTADRIARLTSPSARLRASEGVSPAAVSNGDSSATRTKNIGKTKKGIYVDLWLKYVEIMLDSHSSPISIPAFQSFQSFFKNSHTKAVLLFPQRRAPRQTNLIQISRLRGEPLKKSFGLNPVPVLMGETDVKPTWKATIENVKPTKYATIVIWSTVPELLPTCNIYPKVHLNGPKCIIGIR